MSENNVAIAWPESLAEKPSQLIRLAVEDLEACFQDRQHYTVVRTSWHEPRAVTCYVCLAGGVLAKRLGLPMSVDVSAIGPEYLGDDLPPRIVRELCFLSDVMFGFVNEGLKKLGLEPIPGHDSVHVRSRELFTAAKFAAFKEDALRIANGLEQHDL